MKSWGIANHNKNVFVGTGGEDTINKTHFLGAVCDMEKIMGREKSPVRDIFNYMSENFAQHLPITYILTVRDKTETGELVTRGLYVGDDDEVFLEGAELCKEVNLDHLEKPLQKAIVYLDPEEFKSTWLGNKAVYRTRMAMADDGELIILAPGVKHFGEDSENDHLIRKYGYFGTPNTLKKVEENKDLAENLSVAAHLIHGSSEGRFSITYCTNNLGNGKGLTREEVEGVGFNFTNLEDMLNKYNPEKLKDGWNKTSDGEEVFYISNPALGLWIYG